MKQRSIGRYQIKQEIDHGGMSVVYLAHDPRFRRDVAIKVLSSSMQDQAQVRARFEREARIIAALDHPAIVPVYDFGDEDGQPYLVMRLMPGGSLADLLTFGRLNLADTGHIAERIGGALDVAHSRGVVHRDLKPANILFDAQGEPFLTDFGIVKIFEEESVQASLTGSVVLGTPAYMSPEQALGKPIDKRSDVYALGAVIYEMLTGLPPYKGPTSVSIAMKHVMEPVPHVSEFRPDIPAVLDAIVARAMAKEPSERYESAGELAHAFAEALLELPKAQRTSGAEAAAARKPITEAQARLRQPTPAPPQSNAPSMSTRSEATEQDALLQRSRRWLVWLGIAAGVLAVIGIALTVIAALISPGSATTTATPTISATLTQSMPLPQVVTNESPDASTPAAPPTAPSTATPAAQDSPTTAPAAPQDPVMRVNAGGGNARSGPGTMYPVLRRLPGGTDLLAVAFIRGSDGRLWFEFAFANGQRGFIREDVVTLSSVAAFDRLPASANIPVPPPPTATITPTPTPTPTLPPAPTATFLPTQTHTPTPTPNIPTPTAIPLITPTAMPISAATATLATIDTATPAPTNTTAATIAPAP